MNPVALAVMSLALFLAADRYDRSVGTGYTNPVIVCLLWSAFALCVGIVLGTQIGALIGLIVVVLR